MRTKDKEKINNILSLLDRGRIKDAIRSNAPSFLDNFDFEVVDDMLHSAINSWLIDDLEHYTLLATETKKSFEHPASALEPTHLICDLELQDKFGKKVIIDWKTTSRELDPKWEARYRDSWQWRIYLSYLNADKFVYRGVSTKKGTRDVTLNRYPGLDKEISQYINQFSNMRLSLVGQAPWPRSRPGSCNAFGRLCHYYDDCRDNTYPLDKLIPRSLSYSGMDTFFLCPERHRREELEKLRADAEPEREGNFAAELGNCFHRGAAEIWQQSFCLRLQTLND